MSAPISDYDHPWKDALEEYLPDFLALFFPDIHADVDWSVPSVFLDSELQQIVRDAETRVVRVDKLVRLTLLEGSEDWIPVHVEVQSQEDGDFERRMDTYNVRVGDRYDRYVVSLGVLADERPSWRPGVYQQERWGCVRTFQFRMVKLTDWRDRRAELEASDNPFATVLLAHLAAQETRQDMGERLGAKLVLILQVYDHNYPAERVLSLLRYIDWLLPLPATEESEVRDLIAQIEQERRMPYITSWERSALAEGREQGREQGREEGREEGRLEGREEGRLEEARRAVLRVVEGRFGAPPAGFAAALAAVRDLAQIEALLDAAISAADLATLQSGLGKIQ
jgi:hypothetical protein